MQIDFLKRIINEQRQEMEKTLRDEEIVDREGAGYLERFLKHPNIVVILGPRRSGKSIFSQLLARQTKENFAYINFDDERLIGLKSEDLNKILEAFYQLYDDAELLILDEIQNVAGWELFASRLRRTRKVIITGSNSRLLSGELATALTGRHIDFTLLPFSFREILGGKPDLFLTKEIAALRESWDGYFKGSGFPEFRKFNSPIVTGIYEDIIAKDCIRRYEIKHKKSFRELANYLVSNFSCEFTYSKLSHIFAIKDVHTIKNYIRYLEEAFLILVLERFSPKLKQQFIAPKKVYAIDHGFCNFVSFRLSANMGRLMENIVCLELMRKKALNPRTEIYYWKSHQREEVDFVVKEGHVKSLIQVCYDTQDLDTKTREVKALLKASEELYCDNLLVLTADFESQEKLGGKVIKYEPLWKFLAR
ncbi:MAG: ATP-binding protein [Elusimicrobia bacterium]|nr:ATP-binding protein [Elusimicrobiota bacterium]